MYWLSIVLTIFIVIFGIAALTVPWLIGVAVESAASKILGFIISAIFLWGCTYGLILADIGNLKSTQQTTVIKVNKSERVTDSNGKGARYLVYTDKGVFENTDEWYYWKFNSSDLYNQIQAGKTYSCVTVGWRIEFMSSYKNIVSCNEVSK